MQMTTLKAHRYANKQRKPGDEYEAKASDVRLIKALGWSKEAPPNVAPLEPPRMNFAALDAADAPRAKRTYRRRDLTADET